MCGANPSDQLFRASLLAPAPSHISLSLSLSLSLSHTHTHTHTHEQAGEKISAASALRKAALHKSASGTNSPMRSRGKSMPGTAISGGGGFRAGSSVGGGDDYDEDEDEDIEAFQREWDQAKRDLGEGRAEGQGKRFATLPIGKPSISLTASPCPSLPPPSLLQPSSS